jgi:mannose-6-phosphate isomerase-like protein (cupin superfamily)
VNEVVDFERELATITDHWSPKVVGSLNNDYVKVVKVQGQFHWHHHEDEDEMFLVIRGRIRILLEDDRSVEIGPGQFYVVPKGVEHCPVAEEECWMVLIEPKATAHTGNVVTADTKSIEQQLGRA